MILGPFSLLTGEVPDLDARLPAKHSLRRASDEAKMAVAAAQEALRGPSQSMATSLCSAALRRPASINAIT